MANRDFPSLAQRTTVLAVNALIFYVVYSLATGNLLPTGGLESVWLLSAIALWFLALLSAPWFLPPRDSLTNAVSAASILVTIDLSATNALSFPLDILRWAGVIFCVGIALLSLAALFIHEKMPNNPYGHFIFRLTGIFGKGQFLYTPPALISIVGAYYQSPTIMASLVMLWTLFLVADPVAHAMNAWRIFSFSRKKERLNPVVGKIDRVDHPNIVRVRLSALMEWSPGLLYVAVMAGGKRHYVIALFHQIQGADRMGTGLCIENCQDLTEAGVGEVYQSEEIDKAEEFIARLSGVKGVEIVGFVVERSTIEMLCFEVAMTSSLKQGDVVFVHLENRDIYYQVIGAEISEENFDQNPRGTYIVHAAQIGIYMGEQGFKKYAWLPPMNTPLFGAKTRKFVLPELEKRDFVIGSLPSTNAAVTVNIDDLVQYHAAILGMTGTGKTELALEFVQQAAERKIKVFCVDFTGDYKKRLAHLNPQFPSLTKAEADTLESDLFAVETGEYGAKAEKKVLKATIDKLRKGTEAQIQKFLVDENSYLAILELQEITNSKATLRLTEMYLSTIMKWAQENRQCQQIMIVLEEAHTIIPETAGAGFDGDTQWVVSRIGQIALQGRKYGVGLLVVTQRTALVSKTILSQCNTFFTHSLIDQTSLNFLENVYSAQHTRLIQNLERFQFLAAGKAIHAERAIIVGREFDVGKLEASGHSFKVDFRPPSEREAALSAGLIAGMEEPADGKKIDCPS